MDLRTVATIFRKELLDILRDKKTLIFMIVLPVLFVPALMSGMTRLVVRQQIKTQQMRLVVAIEPEACARWIDFLDSRLAPFAATFEAQLDLFGTPVTEPLQAIASELALTPLQVLVRLHADPAVKRHPRADELRGALATAQREVERKLAGDTAPAGAGTKSADGSAPAGPVRAFLDNDPRMKEMRRFVDLLSPLVTLEYVTMEAAVARPAEGAPMPKEELPPTVARDPELLAAAEAIARRQIHARLHVPRTLGKDLVERDDTVAIEILYDSTIELSKEAHRRVADAVREAGALLVEQRLARPDVELPISFVQPVELGTTNLASTGKQALKAVAGLLPYILILMCFLGGLYPAIDLGAAEKERLTLETLLVTPATRLEIAAGKFGVVFLASLLASLLATGSLAWTFESGIALPELRSVINFQLSPRTTLICLALIVPTAATFASILLALSIYARSFKEAQSYSMPIQFMVIVPAIAALFPQVELNAKYAWIPVLNVSLALRHVLTAGRADLPWSSLAMVFLSTLVVAAAALAFCARRFNQEEVIFRS